MEEKGRTIEDFVGGRVLAWAGALTVLTGIAFLVAVAIGRGWIDEPTRIALAFAGSGAMFVAGGWLYERRGATQAALALTGSGLAGMFLTLTAGTQLYDLYPTSLALAAAFGFGVSGTALAVRWNTRTVAALSIGGALAAPGLVHAPTSDFVAGYLLIVLACSTGVIVMRRWNWLAIGSFVLAVPQLLAWVGTRPAPGLLVAVLAAFALVNAMAAFGYELRTNEPGLRPSSTVLLLGGALVTAAAGYFGLYETGHHALAPWWLAALAAAHVVAGVAALRSRRVSHEIGLLTTVAGGVLADVAFGTLASGPALAAGWGASAAGLALLVRKRGEDRELTRLALGGQLLLALFHVLLFDAPLETLAGGTSDMPNALVGAGSVGLAAFACARLDSANRALAVTFDSIAALALAYATAAALEGPALAATWAGIAAGLGASARREPLAGAFTLGFLGLASLHALVVEAPPSALAFGVDDLVGVSAAFAALGLAALAIARELDSAPPQLRVALVASGATAFLYLASVAIVSVFQPGSETFDPSLALGVRQQGQVLLSALWATAGVAALVVGLRGDQRAARLAGFGLLGLAFGKVIVFDLATLDSIYRVASCIALGLLLLASAFAYQRLRPRVGSVA